MVWETYLTCLLLISDRFTDIERRNLGIVSCTTFTSNVLLLTCTTFIRLYTTSLFSHLLFPILIDNFFITLSDNVQNISTNFETVTAAANTQVQLKCITSYSKFLKAETFWMFQGKNLNETDSRYKTETYKLNTSELTQEGQMSLWISNVSDPDFGFYSCAMNTSMGLSSATIVLAQMETGTGI